MTQPDARESAVAATVAPLPAVDLMCDGIAPQQPGYLSTRRWALWTVPALAVALAAGGDSAGFARQRVTRGSREVTQR